MKVEVEYNKSECQKAVSQLGNVLNEVGVDTINYNIILDIKKGKESHLLEAVKDNVSVEDALKKVIHGSLFDTGELQQIQGALTNLLPYLDEEEWKKRGNKENFAELNEIAKTGIGKLGKQYSEQVNLIEKRAEEYEEVTKTMREVKTPDISEEEPNIYDTMVIDQDSNVSMVNDEINLALKVGKKGNKYEPRGIIGEGFFLPPSDAKSGTDISEEEDKFATTKFSSKDPNKKRFSLPPEDTGHKGNKNQRTDIRRFFDDQNINISSSTTLRLDPKKLDVVQENLKVFKPSDTLHSGGNLDEDTTLEDTEERQPKGQSFDISLTSPPPPTGKPPSKDVRPLERVVPEIKEFSEEEGESSEVSYHTSEEENEDEVKILPQESELHLQKEEKKVEDNYQKITKTKYMLSPGKKAEPQILSPEQQHKILKDIFAEDSMILKGYAKENENKGKKKSFFSREEEPLRSAIANVLGLKQVPGPLVNDIGALIKSEPILTKSKKESTWSDIINREALLKHWDKPITSISKRESTNINEILEKDRISINSDTDDLSDELEGIPPLPSYQLNFGKNYESHIIEESEKELVTKISTKGETKETEEETPPFHTEPSLSETIINHSTKALNVLATGQCKIIKGDNEEEELLGNQERVELLTALQKTDSGSLSDTIQKLDNHSIPSINEVLKNKGISFTLRYDDGDGDKGDVEENTENKETTFANAIITVALSSHINGMEKGQIEKNLGALAVQCGVGEQWQKFYELDQSVNKSSGEVSETEKLHEQVVSGVSKVLNEKTEELNKDLSLDHDVSVTEKSVHIDEVSSDNKQLVVFFEDLNRSDRTENVIEEVMEEEEINFVDDRVTGFLEYQFGKLHQALNKEEINNESRKEIFKVISKQHEDPSQVPENLLINKDELRRYIIDWYVDKEDPVQAFLDNLQENGLSEKNPFKPYKSLTTRVNDLTNPNNNSPKVVALANKLAANINVAKQRLNAPNLPKGNRALASLIALNEEALGKLELAASSDGVIIGRKDSQATTEVNNIKSTAVKFMKAKQPLDKKNINDLVDLINTVSAKLAQEGNTKGKHGREANKIRLNIEKLWDGNNSLSTQRKILKNIEKAAIAFGKVNTESVDHHRQRLLDEAGAAISTGEKYIRKGRLGMPTDKGESYVDTHEGYTTGKQYQLDEIVESRPNIMENQIFRRIYDKQKKTLEQLGEVIKERISEDLDFKVSPKLNEQINEVQKNLKLASEKFFTKKYLEKAQIAAEKSKELLGYALGPTNPTFLEGMKPSKTEEWRRWWAESVKERDVKTPYVFTEEKTFRHLFEKEMLLKDGKRNFHKLAAWVAKQPGIHGVLPDLEQNLAYLRKERDLKPGEKLEDKLRKEIIKKKEDNFQVVTKIGVDQEVEKEIGKINAAKEYLVKEGFKLWLLNDPRKSRETRFKVAALFKKEDIFGLLADNAAEQKRMLHIKSELEFKIDAGKIQDDLKGQETNEKLENRRTQSKEKGDALIGDVTQNIKRQMDTDSFVAKVKRQQKPEKSR